MFLPYRSKLFHHFRRIMLSVCGVVVALILLEILLASGPAYPELKELASSEQSFPQLTHFFQNLAQKRGAVYAFAALKAAELSPNTDLHLLGHVVGDELFKKEGASGITKCTEDFRNACSHSIVVGLFLREGELALPKIAEVCRKAPGGIGAYTMCFHGLGHGVLAALDYDLPRTISECQKTSTAQYEFREGSECVGGTIMEMISGGAHNKELWQKKSQVYFKASDPLYPCDADFVPPSSRVMCYMYLTPHLIRSVEGDLGSPQAEDFVKAFSLCEQIPINERLWREACFGGFGKEFLVLATHRDIRDIENMTNEQLHQVIVWCQLATDTDGIRACIRSAVGSLFWGGENDEGGALRFCGLIPDNANQSVCYDYLIGAVGYYVPDTGRRREFCKKIASMWQAQCRQQLLSQL